MAPSGSSLRRISWVRIVVEAGGPVCEAFGVAHRLPAARRISLATALSMADRGVPLVVRAAAPAPAKAPTPVRARRPATTTGAV